MGASRHDEPAAWRDGVPAGRLAPDDPRHGGRVVGGPSVGGPALDPDGYPRLDDPDLDDAGLDDPDLDDAGLDDPDLDDAGLDDPDIDPDIDDPGTADPFVTIRTCTPRLARRRPRRLRGPGYRPSR